jgi:hypothetical protein
MKYIIPIGQGDEYLLIQYKSVELLVDSQAMISAIYDNLEIILALKYEQNLAEQNFPEIPYHIRDVPFRMERTRIYDLVGHDIIGEPFTSHDARAFAEDCEYTFTEVEIPYIAAVK